MYVYIFEYVSQLTANYHCGGGLVVFARSVEEVEELVSKESPSTVITEHEWEEVYCFELKTKAFPKVMVFRDAGCC